MIEPWVGTSRCPWLILSDIRSSPDQYSYRSMVRLATSTIAQSPKMGDFCLLTKGLSLASDGWETTCWTRYGWGEIRVGTPSVPVACDLVAGERSSASE